MKTPKVELAGLGELFAMGAVKSIEERALTGIIGNGSLKSGAIKGAAGIAASKFVGGGAGRVVGGALIVDAVEDVIVSFLGGMGQDTSGDW